MEAGRGHLLVIVVSLYSRMFCMEGVHSRYTFQEGV